MLVRYEVAAYDSDGDCIFYSRKVYTDDIERFVNRLYAQGASDVSWAVIV